MAQKSGSGLAETLEMHLRNQDYNNLIKDISDFLEINVIENSPFNRAFNIFLVLVRIWRFYHLRLQRKSLKIDTRVFPGIPTLVFFEQLNTSFTLINLFGKLSMIRCFN